MSFDRYIEGDDFETPDQKEPIELKGKFADSIQDDEGNDFGVYIDYSYREFWGEVSDFECTVKPLGPYVMTVESFKESVGHEVYSKIKYYPKEQEIIIL